MLDREITRACPRRRFTTSFVDSAPLRHQSLYPDNGILLLQGCLVQERASAHNYVVSGWDRSAPVSNHRSSSPLRYLLDLKVRSVNSKRVKHPVEGPLPQSDRIVSIRKLARIQPCIKDSVTVYNRSGRIATL